MNAQVTLALAVLMVVAATPEVQRKLAESLWPDMTATKWTTLLCLGP